MWGVGSRDGGRRRLVGLPRVDTKGKRRIRYTTVKGTRQDAQKEPTRVRAQHDAGKLPEPSKLTVAEYLRSWLGEEPKEGEPPPAPPADLSPKTAERYREVAEAIVAAIKAALRTGRER
jgi:hypothetical protein